VSSTRFKVAEQENLGPVYNEFRLRTVDSALLGENDAGQFVVQLTPANCPLLFNVLELAPLTATEVWQALILTFAGTLQVD
jgi:hypothetical protein